MDSSTINPEQAAQVNRSLFRSLNYLARLRTRMERVGFPPRDHLMRLVDEAYNAVQALHVATHYLSCTSGVGRERRTGN